MFNAGAETFLEKACSLRTVHENAENVAHGLYAQSGCNVGVGVAGNNGRPAGAMGCPRRGINPTKVHPGHRTQEEHVFSAVTTAIRDRPDMQRDLCERFLPMYGMVHPDGTDRKTKQGVDYGKLRYPDGHSAAFVLPHTRLCPTRLQPNLTRRFDTRNTFPVTLVVGAGPNANPALTGTGPSSTMRRTFNPHAARDYDFFRQCVKSTLRTTLDAMILQKVHVPVLAMVSCGIYAGEHKPRIRAEFEDVVRELLDEPVGYKSCARGQYFYEVLIAAGQSV